ncbi:MAG: Zn-ribbon containing protein [Candidatus Nanoarchaeia archaeon]|nr:Zn-ribbon containing protein [Candidatus Nanoarchaeia archaeon]
MPHQCVKCNTLYEDDDNAILLEGCRKCGSKFFFYVKKNQIKESQEYVDNLSSQDKKEIEDDLKEIIGIKDEKPVVLSFESIKVLRPGKYEIDIVKLFKADPLIYSYQDGKYFVDLAGTFSNMNKDQK